jgi:microcystin-dependent protein
MALTHINAIADNSVTQEKIHGGGITPTGTILPFASDTPPTGWLLCDGSDMSRGDYPDLFAVCGETYGAGDGSTTFTIPDLADRIPVGKGSTKTSLGSKGGAIDMTPSGSLSGGAVSSRTLCNQQLPSHNHGGGNHNHTFCATSIHVGASWAAGGGGNHGNGYINSSGTIINSCGLGCSHDHAFVQPSFTGSSMSIEQPYTVINYIIKY